MCSCCKKKKPPPRTDKEIFYEPPIPVLFKNAGLEDLHEGTSLIITGVTKPGVTFQSIFIHLICDNKTQDHALLLNPRAVIKLFLCNTKIRDFWGDEVAYQSKHDPLKPGSNFSIEILITDACYMMAANGFHFAKYNHRVPYKLVKCIAIRGDIEQVNVDRVVVQHYPERWPQSLPKEIPTVGDFNFKCPCEVEYDPKEEEKAASSSGAAKALGTTSKYPTRNISPMDIPLTDIPTPYYGELLPIYFTVGRCLKIDGQISMVAHSLQVSLQHSQDVWPQPEVVFLFSARFAVESKGWRDHAIGSYYTKGKWNEDPWVELKWDTNLRRGRRFTLYIVYCKKQFEVYTGGELILTFPHRMPLKIMDMLLIQGDFNMFGVVLQTEYNPEEAT